MACKPDDVVHPLTGAPTVGSDRADPSPASLRCQRDVRHGGRLRHEGSRALNVTSTLGLNPITNEYDALYAFGGRAFSIWDDKGKQVWDSGAEFDSRPTANAPPVREHLAGRFAFDEIAGGGDLVERITSDSERTPCWLRPCGACLPSSSPRYPRPSTPK